MIINELWEWRLVVSHWFMSKKYVRRWLWSGNIYHSLIRHAIFELCTVLKLLYQNKNKLLEIQISKDSNDNEITC